MFKLLLLDLKNYRKYYFRFFSIVFISLLLCFLILIISFNFQVYQEHQRKEIYGSYHGALYDMALGDVENIKENQMIQEVCVGERYGLVSKDDLLLGELGYYDQYELLNLRLYKGRMPKYSKEVVMEMSVLDSLKVSYNLNQSIPLMVDGKKQEFKLVGILYNFSSLHKKEDNTMINIVTIKLDSKSFNCYFKVKEEFRSLINDFNVYGDRFVVNNYTYLTQYSSHHFIVLYIFVFGVLSLIIVSQNLAEIRKQQFLLFDYLGMIKKNYIMLFFVEKNIVFCVAVLINSLILGIIYSVLLNTSFIIPWKDLYNIFLSYLFLNFLLCTFDYLTINKKTVNKIKDRRIKNKKLTLFKINYIFNFTYFKSYFVKILLTTFSLSVSLIGVIDLYHKYMNYNDVINDYPFSYYYGDLSIPYENNYPIYKDEYKQLFYVYGIKEINSICQSPYYNISYNGDNNEYAQFVKNEVIYKYTGQKELMGSLYGISESLLDEYQNMIQKGSLSKDEFNNNHIILHLPTYYSYKNYFGIKEDVKLDNNYLKEYKEETLKVGDEIIINGKKLIVSAIIYDNDSSFYSNIYRPYGIICNQNIYHEITGLTDYHFISIVTNNNINYGQCDAEMSRLKFVNVSLNNIHNEKENMAKELYTSCVSITILLVSSMLGFKIIFKYINRSYQLAKQRFYNIAKRVYIDKKMIILLNLMDHVSTYFISFIFSIIVTFIWLYYQYYAYLEDINNITFFVYIKEYIFNIPFIIFIVIFIINIFLYRENSKSID